MYTRRYRETHNIQLGTFDLDPHLSNFAELPAPQHALPESINSPVAQSPETAFDFDSPLTDLSALSPAMSPVNDNAQSGQMSNANNHNESTNEHHAPQPSVNQEHRDKRPQDYKIEKFLEGSMLKASGSNYVTWKRRILLALRNRKWEEYVLGTIVCPSRDTDPQAYETWKHVDSLVASQIASNMEDSLYGEISTDDMSSASLWKAVKDRFEESSELAQTTLHAKLCGKRIQENESMKEHILELRRLKAEYSNRGGRLTNAQWHSIIVSSLEQHSYWHQMDLYADIIDDPEVLIKKLELKELRGGGRAMNSNAALRAQQLQQQPQPRGPTRFANLPNRPLRLLCTNCRCPGHSAPNCYAPGGGAAHHRPSWYRVTPEMLEKECAQLTAQLYAIDQQRAQLAESFTRTQTPPMPSVNPSSDRESSSSSRHEILMVVDSSPVKDPSVWILDSGATSHMTYHRNHFVEYREIEPLPIYTARENNLLYAVGTGTVRVVFQVGASNVPALINNVLYVPEICANLISLAKLDERGIEYHGQNGQLHFSNNHKPIACATRIDGQWIMQMAPCQQSSNLASTKQDLTKGIDVWHRRLAHVNQQRIFDLERNSAVLGLDISNTTMDKCEACVLSKMAATTAESRNMRAQAPGDVIHSDIEFMGHHSFSQAQYSLKFIDEYSNHVWVHALKDKQATTVHVHWMNLVSLFLTQFSIRVKALHSDNGSEFVNNIMDKYNSENGIDHHKIAPHRHEMNGKVERLNRAGSDAVRSMLFSSGLPEAYWAEAYETFAYVHNRTSSSAIQYMTPHELLYKRKPDVGHVRIFGCTAYMRIPPEERRKLDPKAKKLILIGYREDAAYRLFDPESRKVYYSRDVIFDEFQSFHVATPPPDAKIEEVREGEALPSEPVKQDSIRRSTRAFKPTQRKLESLEQETSLSHLDHTQYSNVVRERRVVAGIPIPRDAHEAFRSVHSQHWITAMQYEISKLESMDCWDVVEKPSDIHVINGLWVYNLKEEVDGSLEYRARWVARGDSQIPGLEFDDTFASSGDYVIARIVFALAAKSNRSLITLDIKSAYLHSPLEQNNLFVTYPTGFDVPGFLTPCCHLRKALYGLRQGARAWEQHLTKQLASIGFNKCISAPSAYIRLTDEGEDIMATHVDDLQNSSESSVGDAAQAFKEDIRRLFDFKEKDTKNKAKVLGMTIHNDEENGKVKISVGSRIDGMLQRYNMESAKAADSPMLVNALATFDHDASEDCEQSPWPYAQLIGELLWMGNAVRPDITFAVNVLARYLKKPKKCHWEAAKRILRYLKGTRSLSIAFKTMKSAVVTGYSDSDWAADPTDRKSTAGYVFTYSGGPISWKSRKQNVVATSTAEAEYLAASTATNEAKWLRTFFSEINRHQTEPTTIFVDNMASIFMTQNPVYYSKTKHIDIRAHHIRDEVTNGTIRLQHIDGNQNPADIFTKPLPPLLHKKCVELLGME